METRELKIDEEFKNLIPPLLKEEFEQLKQNIIADGCRDPLVIWNGVIVDGHNRYMICTKNNILFNTVEKEFESKEDVMIWICQNQRGRRNITEQQKEYLLGKEYEATKKKLGGAEYSSKKTVGQNDHSFSTAEKVAKQHGIGEKTVRRSEEFAKSVDKIAKISPVTKEKILSGEVKAPKKELRSIHKKSDEEIKEMAKQIESNEYQKPISTKRTEEEQTKICNECDQELLLSKFRKGRGVCKDCTSLKPRTQKDIKGNILRVAEEYKHIKEEDVIGDLYNVDREIRYDIHDLIQEFHVNFTTYARNLENILEQHKELLRDSENNKKIMVELSEAVTTISNMKGKYLYE